MVIARGTISAAINIPATASIRVQPVNAITTALTMTATDPRASLTTSRNAARMFRFAPRPEFSTSIDTRFPSRPTMPNASSPPAVTSGGSNNRRPPSMNA